jgi:hypothetical protein
MVRFTPQRGGDYQFITEMYNKCRTVWRDEVVASVQIKGNFGNRTDLKDQPITVNLATYPPRRESLKKVLNNLLSYPFIDIIRVYMNNYTEVPDDLPQSDRILYHIAETDLKDSGKFFWANEARGEYYFTADDDLLYSEDYFWNHIRALRRYNNQIIVTSHAKVLKPQPKAFNDFILSIRCLNNYPNDEWVNQPGTGVMAFDLNKFQFPREMFKTHGMSDMWIAWYAQKHNTPVMCRQHQANELQYIDQGADTLFEQRFNLHPEHMKIIEDVGNWKVNSYQTKLP